MDLAHHLSDKKRPIVKSWFDIAVESYPAETQAFLNRQKDRFANPVGHTLLQGLEALFDELSGATDFGKAASSLEDIIKIRALEDMPPSRALAFLFDLKGIVRRELGPAAASGSPFAEELSRFDEKIDYLTLIAFDLYLHCRERLYDIKASEARNRTAKLVERANDLFERYYKESNTKGRDQE